MTCRHTIALPKGDIMESIEITASQPINSAEVLDVPNVSYVSMASGARATVGYINAGGRGTRLNSLFTPNPETGIAKAMLEIGRPAIKLIDHHITNLRQQNIENVVVAAGDQAELYEYLHDEYWDDRSLSVTRSARQLGTGGDLVTYARGIDGDAPLLVQNVDTIIDLDLNKFSSEFTRKCPFGAVACIALTLNQGVPNEGAFTVGMRGRVLASNEFRNTKSKNSTASSAYQGASTGAVIISPEFLRKQNWREGDGQLSLYSDCLANAWQAKGLFAYNNRNNFFRDVGTVAAWIQSQADTKLQSQLRYSNQQLSYSTKEG